MLQLQHDRSCRKILESKSATPVGSMPVGFCESACGDAGNIGSHANSTSVYNPPRPRSAKARQEMVLLVLVLYPRRMVAMNAVCNRPKGRFRR